MHNHHSNVFNVLALVVSAGAIAACSALQIAPQPVPLPQPSQPSAPIPSPGAGPVEWKTILRTASAPDGWLVYPCDNPTLLCIQVDGTLTGTVELGVYPIEDSEFQTLLADAGVSTTEINPQNPKVLELLKVWVGNHYTTIERDRQFGVRDVAFSGLAPEVMLMGQLRGLRYGFTTTRPNGTLFERMVGYVTTDGKSLYVIVTGLINGDPTGTFVTDGALSQFEPYLDQIVAGLNLSVQN